jgi:hypothetical protein
MHRCKADTIPMTTPRKTQEHPPIPQHRQYATHDCASPGTMKNTQGIKRTNAHACVYGGGRERAMENGQHTRIERMNTYAWGATLASGFTMTLPTSLFPLYGPHAHTHTHTLHCTALHCTALHCTALHTHTHTHYNFLFYLPLLFSSLSF